MTQGPYDADRQRLHDLVDRWVDFLNEDDPGDNERVIVAFIGGMLHGPSDDDDAEAEGSAPSFMCESKQPHVQVGVARLVARSIEMAALGEGPYEDA